jgi:mRNA-degrading endonuclease RelE of RelBE toxin-antitoxin system
MHDAKALGVFRQQSNGYTQWLVDTNGDHAWEPTDATYYFGINGDIPIMGDWTETGHLQMGIYRNGYWYADYNDNKQWDAADQIYAFGLAGDVPVVGDWDHTGKLRIGVYRVINGYGWWYVDMLGCLDNGGHGCNFNPSYYQVYQFGLAGDIPLLGDWDHTGKLRIGIYRPSQGAFYVDLSGCNCTASVGVYYYGTAGQHGIVGDWTGTGSGPTQFRGFRSRGILDHRHE